MEMTEERMNKLVKIGVVGGVGLLVAPFIFLAIKGIVGLALAIGVVAVAYNVAPVVALKLENWKNRSIDSERIDNIKKVEVAAGQNPIETLVQQSMQKRMASDKFKTAIQMFATEVKNFDDQIATFEKEYPDDVERFRKQSEAMHKLLDFRKDRYTQLQQELDNFDDAIKRAKAMWKMSQAAQKMNQLAGMEIGDQFEKIKADAAIDSVMTSVNSAMAQMETALLDNKELVQSMNQPKVGVVGQLPVAERIS